MANIYIHPTATSRQHIEAIQARTGLVAVLGKNGPARLIQDAQRPSPAARLKARLARSFWTPPTPDDFPPGAA